MATATKARATPTASQSVASSPVLDWLLDDRWPAVRRLALLTLLDRSPEDPDVADLTAALAGDPWVAPLLAGKMREGVTPPTPVHAYSKWAGAHWRLFALAELGVTVETPGAEDRLRDALELELAWLGSPGRQRRIKPIEGRYRNCSSQEGAGLWAAVRLGLGNDPRLLNLVERLVLIQWPDGGWNCDRRPDASHSSFNESWMPLRGLVAARSIPGVDSLPGLQTAIDRSVEFFLRHRIVESERTGDLASERVGLLRWPPYWHYALIPGLRAVAEAGHLGDPRAMTGVRRLIAARDHDGRWWPDGRYWTGPGSKGSGMELVRWGRDGEPRMLTLQALQLMRLAGVPA
jgi:hypothetical protein